MFLLSSYYSKFNFNIITCSGVITVLFIMDWPEVCKSERPASEFPPTSGDWDKLGIPNFAGMSLMKSYGILQNVRFTSFTISELRENQWFKIPHTHTHMHTHTHTHTCMHTHMHTCMHTRMNTHTQTKIRVKGARCSLRSETISGNVKSFKNV